MTEEALAQDIANELTALAYWVRMDPTDARGYVGRSEAITKKMRELYALVGEP